MNFIMKNKGKIIAGIAVIAALVFAFSMTGNPPEKEEFAEENVEIVAENTQAEEIAENAETEEKIEAEDEKVPQKEEKKELYCTLSISCETILEDISRLDESKRDLVGNGIILPATKVEFSEGESVFDVLLRETKERKIHLEFVNTPIYGSVYVEGIGNLYEFDAGELSGWMYRVNGEFPNFGCSKYILKNGDKVEFVYTCDLGKDVGGSYSENSGG
ncbi:MAG: DUF4430 domain-containing protein [Clostridia bacterium]|nr:DUF4430 domain-containing protein [Clostridia bacterium]